MNLVDELERLQALRAQGVISEQEFAAGKQLLLSAQPGSSAVPAELPPMTAPAPSPAGMSGRSEPAEFDWSHISEASADSSNDPPVTAKLLGDTVLRCLFSGGILGMAVANAGSLGITRGLVVGLLAGLFVWTPIALGVESSRRSKTTAALLVRFLHGVLCVMSFVSLLYMLGWAYYVYVEQGGAPQQTPTLPRAIIN